MRLKPPVCIYILSSFEGCKLPLYCKLLSCLGCVSSTQTCLTQLSCWCCCHQMMKWILSEQSFYNSDTASTNIKVCLPTCPKQQKHSSLMMVYGWYVNQQSDGLVKHKLISSYAYILQTVHYASQLIAMKLMSMPQYSKLKSFINNVFTSHKVRCVLVVFLQCNLMHFLTKNAGWLT